MVLKYLNVSNTVTLLGLIKENMLTVFVVFWSWDFYSIMVGLSKWERLRGTGGGNEKTERGREGERKKER